MEAQTYEEFMSGIKKKALFPAKLRPKPTSPRRRYKKETPGTNAVYSQLYHARREAKKTGLKAFDSVKLWIYPHAAMFYDIDGRIFKFDLKGLEPPADAITVSLYFNQFLNVLQAADRVTPDIKFKWDKYWVWITGKTSRMSIEVKLPCVIKR